MKIEGIITPIVTPFYDDAEQNINYEATKDLIDHLIDHGVKGIFILGSNGEFHVIDEDEKIAFAKKVIEIVDIRVPVYVEQAPALQKPPYVCQRRWKNWGRMPCPLSHLFSEAHQ